MDKLIAEAEELFSEIGEIVSEHQKTQRERDKNGENFNVFKALGVQRNKECLHSAFIAELLDPKGTHGMKDTFLKLFKIQTIDSCYNNWDFDTQHAVVHKEYSFEDGRIDILVENQGKGIIIENKIDACDQEEQLLRYDQFGKLRYHRTENYQLIYLTPDGIEASKKSTKKDKDLDNRYIMASYKEDIMPWLTQCLKKCVPASVQETLIQQYQNNLKDILGMMMDEKSTERLVKTAVSKSNIEATLAIINHQTSIRKAIIEIFIKRMKKIAFDKYGLECDVRGDLSNLENKSGLLFFYPKKHWALYIGAEKHLPSYGVFYGITQRDEGEKLRITQKQLKEIKPVWDNQDTDYPLGRFSLYRHDTTRKWYCWKEWQVIEDMANRELSEWIERYVFREVLDGNNCHKKNLLKYIERLTKED